MEDLPMVIFCKKVNGFSAVHRVLYPEAKSAKHMPSNSGVSSLSSYFSGKQDIHTTSESGAIL